MAFEKNIYEFKTLLLVLIGIPLIASTNIDCSGKSFHCLNSTHFMICVDLGGGISTTVDDFVIPCPPPTVCLGTNRFECEFPAVTVQTIVDTNDIESTTLAWEEISVTDTSPNIVEEHLELSTVSGVQDVTTDPAVTLFEVANETNSVSNSTESVVNVVTTPVVTPTEKIEPNDASANENVTIATETIQQTTTGPLVSPSQVVNETTPVSNETDSVVNVETTSVVTPTEIIEPIDASGNENVTIATETVQITTTDTFVSTPRVVNETTSVFDGTESVVNVQSTDVIKNITDKIELIDGNQNENATSAAENVQITTNPSVSPPTVVNETNPVSNGSENIVNVETTPIVILTEIIEPKDASGNENVTIATETVQITTTDTFVSTPRVVNETTSVFDGSESVVNVETTQVITNTTEKHELIDANLNENVTTATETVQIITDPSVSLPQVVNGTESVVNMETTPFITNTTEKIKLINPNPNENVTTTTETVQQTTDPSVSTLQVINDTSAGSNSTESVVNVETTPVVTNTTGKIELIDANQNKNVLTTTETVHQTTTGPSVSPSQVVNETTALFNVTESVNNVVSTPVLTNLTGNSEPEVIIIENVTTAVETTEAVQTITPDSSVTLPQVVNDTSLISKGSESVVNVEITPVITHATEQIAPIDVNGKENVTTATETVQITTTGPSVSQQQVVNETTSVLNRTESVNNVVSTPVLPNLTGNSEPEVIIIENVTTAVETTEAVQTITPDSVTLPPVVNGITLVIRGTESINNEVATPVLTNSEPVEVIMIENVTTTMETAEAIKTTTPVSSVILPQVANETNSILNRTESIINVESAKVVTNESEKIESNANMKKNATAVVDETIQVTTSDPLPSLEVVNRTGAVANTSIFIFTNTSTVPIPETNSNHNETVAVIEKELFEYTTETVLVGDTTEYVITNITPPEQFIVESAAIPVNTTTQPTNVTESNVFLTTTDSSVSQAMNKTNETETTANVGIFTDETIKKTSFVQGKVNMETTHVPMYFSEKTEPMNASIKENVTKVIDPSLNLNKTVNEISSIANVSQGDVNVETSHVPIEPINASINEDATTVKSTSLHLVQTTNETNVTKGEVNAETYSIVQTYSTEKIELMNANINENVTTVTDSLLSLVQTINETNLGPIGVKNNVNVKNIQDKIYPAKTPELIETSESKNVTVEDIIYSTTTDSFLPIFETASDQMLVDNEGVLVGDTKKPVTDYNTTPQPIVVEISSNEPVTVIATPQPTIVTDVSVDTVTSVQTPILGSTENISLLNSNVTIEETRNKIESPAASIDSLNGNASTDILIEHNLTVQQTDDFVNPAIKQSENVKNIIDIASEVSTSAQGSVRNNSTKAIPEPKQTNFVNKIDGSATESSALEEAVIGLRVTSVDAITTQIPTISKGTDERVIETEANSGKIFDKNTKETKDSTVVPLNPAAIMKTESTANITLTDASSKGVTEENVPGLTESQPINNSISTANIDIADEPTIQLDIKIQGYVTNSIKEPVSISTNSSQGNEGNIVISSTEVNRNNLPYLPETTGANNLLEIHVKKTDSVIESNSSFVRSVESPSLDSTNKTSNSSTVTNSVTINTEEPTVTSSIASTITTETVQTIRTVSNLGITTDSSYQTIILHKPNNVNTDVSNTDSVLKSTTDNKTNTNVLEKFDLKPNNTIYIDIEESTTEHILAIVTKNEDNLGDKNAGIDTTEALETNNGKNVIVTGTTTTVNGPLPNVDATSNIAPPLVASSASMQNNNKLNKSVTEEAKAVFIEPDREASTINSTTYTLGSNSTSQQLQNETTLTEVIVASITANNYSNVIKDSTSISADKPTANGDAAFENINEGLVSLEIQKNNVVNELSIATDKLIKPDDSSNIKRSDSPPAKVNIVDLNIDPKMTTKDNEDEILLTDSFSSQLSQNNVNKQTKESSTPTVVIANVTDNLKQTVFEIDKLDKNDENKNVADSKLIQTESKPYLNQNNGPGTTPPVVVEESVITAPFTTESKISFTPEKTNKELDKTSTSSALYEINSDASINTSVNLTGDIEALANNESLLVVGTNGAVDLTHDKLDGVNVNIVTGISYASKSGTDGANQIPVSLHANTHVQGLDTTMNTSVLLHSTTAETSSITKVEKEIYQQLPKVDEARELPVSIQTDQSNIKVEANSETIREKLPASVKNNQNVIKAEEDMPKKVDGLSISPVLVQMNDSVIKIEADISRPLSETDEASVSIQTKQFEVNVDKEPSDKLPKEVELSQSPDLKQINQPVTTVTNSPIVEKNLTNQNLNKHLASIPTSTKNIIHSKATTADKSSITASNATNPLENLLLNGIESQTYSQGNSQNVNKLNITSNAKRENISNSETQLNEPVVDHIEVGKIDTSQKNLPENEQESVINEMKNMTQSLVIGNDQDVTADLLVKDTQSFDYESKIVNVAAPIILAVDKTVLKTEKSKTIFTSQTSPPNHDTLEKTNKVISNTNTDNKTTLNADLILVHKTENNEGVHSDTAITKGNNEGESSKLPKSEINTTLAGSTVVRNSYKGIEATTNNKGIITEFPGTSPTVDGPSIITIAANHDTSTTVSPTIQTVKIDTNNVESTTLSISTSTGVTQKTPLDDRRDVLIEQDKVNKAANMNTKTSNPILPDATGIPTLPVIDQTTTQPLNQENTDSTTITTSKTEINTINNIQTAEPQHNIPQTYETTSRPTTTVTTRIATKSVNSQFKCQDRPTGRYADNNDCRKFYICSGIPQPVVGLCPLNTVFSDIRKQCTKNLSHCFRNNQFKCIVPGRYTDFINPNVYYICVRRGNLFMKFKLQCQNGFFLNKTTVRCYKTVESQSVSQSISTDVSQSATEKSIKEKKKVKKSKKKSEFECEEEGKFPDPDNCRKYYICTKTNASDEYQRKTKKCEKDEVFHRKKKKCVDADSYECSQ